MGAWPKTPGSDEGHAAATPVPAAGAPTSTPDGRDPGLPTHAITAPRPVVTVAAAGVLLAGTSVGYKTGRGCGLSAYSLECRAEYG